MYLFIEKCHLYTGNGLQKICLSSLRTNSQWHERKLGFFLIEFFRIFKFRVLTDSKELNYQQLRMVHKLTKKIYLLTTVQIFTVGADEQKLLVPLL